MWQVKKHPLIFNWRQPANICFRAQGKPCFPLGKNGLENLAGFYWRPPPNLISVEAGQQQGEWKMKRNCLSCKYEPEWGDMVGREYPRRTGTCMFEVVIQTLPSCYSLTSRSITRHEDDSGIETNCRAWKEKSKISAWPRGRGGVGCAAVRSGVDPVKYRRKSNSS